MLLTLEDHNKPEPLKMMALATTCSGTPQLRLGQETEKVFIHNISNRKPVGLFPDLFATPSLHINRSVITSLPRKDNQLKQRLRITYIRPCQFSNIKL